MSVLMILFDGVGIGERSNPHNPFCHVRSEIFAVCAGSVHCFPAPIPREGMVVATDATLAIPGRPQSGTGHTTLLTGINAAKLVSRHVPAYPTQILRTLLATHGIFPRLAAAGKRATLVNAYRPAYLVPFPRRRLSASTCCALAAGLPLHDVEAIRREEALHADFSNRSLIAEGFDLPAQSPEGAARTLAAIAARHDFSLYEYYRTDLIGHRQDFPEAVAVVASLERFLAALLGAVDLQTMTVAVVSDHGNLEDLRSRLHTRNPVPTWIWGKNCYAVAKEISSLMDILPALLKCRGLVAL
ncbi:MAG: peptidase [Nitrospinae bacterium]|nr:peptidase [Nitrospinota bacterium]